MFSYFFGGYNSAIPAPATRPFTPEQRCCVLEPHVRCPAPSLQRRIKFIVDNLHKKPSNSARGAEFKRCSITPFTDRALNTSNCWRLKRKFIRKLTFTLPVKKLPEIVELNCSLPDPQKPAMTSYPLLCQLNPALPYTLYLSTIHVNTISQKYFGVTTGVTSDIFLSIILQAFLILTRATLPPISSSLT
jgi:hypothetical protein